MEADTEIETELVERVAHYTPSEGQPRVDVVIPAAVQLAKEVHAGFTRPDRTPYLIHVVNVARILSDWQAPPEIVAAGLLHDALKAYRSRSPSLEPIQLRIGQRVADLVQAVSELGRFEPYRFVDKPDETVQEGYVETRLPWIAPSLQKHPEAAIIRFASRLEKLRSWEDRRPEERTNYVTATLDMFVPVANRLGMWSVKRELEDNAFRLFYPEQYGDACRQFSDEDRERWTQPILARLRQKLVELEVKAEVGWEPVSLYSQFRHRKRPNAPNSLAYPIRIVTNDQAECYAVLGLVHGLWSPVAGTLRDFIAVPKTNNYRGVHTRVRYNREMSFLVVIRDQEMEMVAEWGLAAEWRGAPKSALPRLPEWEEPPKGRIVVFTEDGDSRSLPEGSTALDFAYAIGPEVGHQYVEALVNNRKVLPSTPLQTGDVVEISRSPIGGGPPADSLNYVKTRKAKREIRKLFDARSSTITGVDNMSGGLTRTKEAAMTMRAVQTGSHTVLVPDLYADLPVRLAECCEPSPPDDIVGRLTRDRQLTIHRRDCRIVKTESRLVSNVRWETSEQAYTQQCEIIALDRDGLVHDVSSVFAERSISFSSFVADSMPDGSARILMGMGSIEADLRDLVSEDLKSIRGLRKVTWGCPGVPPRFAIGSVAYHFFTNPYTLQPVTGGMFFGRLDEMKELSRNLYSIHTEESVLLWGPRRIGKTSLLKEFSRQLQSDGDYLPIYVDLQRVSHGTTIELLHAMLEELALGAAQPGVASPHFRRLRQDPLGSFRGFMERLRRSEMRHLIVILDEFEELAMLEEDAISLEDILKYLRSLALSERGVGFVFSGGGQLKILLRHAGISPLLNVAHYQKIGCLDPENARGLITTPVTPFASYSPEAVDKLLELTGCHPYYLQLMCRELAAQSQSRRLRILDSSLLESMLVDWLPEQPQSYFEHLWGTTIGLDRATEMRNKLILAAIAGLDKRCVEDEEIRHQLEAVQAETTGIDTLLDGLVEIETLERRSRGYGFKVELARLWIRENLDMYKTAKEVLV